MLAHLKKQLKNQLQGWGQWPIGGPAPDNIADVASDEKSDGGFLHKRHLSCLGCTFLCLTQGATLKITASVISPPLFYRVISNFTWPLWKRDSWDRRRPFCQRSRDSFPLRLPGRQFSNSALRGSGMGEPNKTIFYQVKTKWFHIIHLGLSAAYKSKYEINCLNNVFPQYIWSPISYVWYLTILFAILFNLPSDLLLSPIWYSGLCLQLHNSFQPAYWFSSEFIIRVFKDKLGAASPSKVESQLVLE